VERSGVPPPPPGVPVWAPFAVLAAVIVAIGIFGVIALGVIAAADPSVDVTDPPDWITIALTVVQDAAFVGAAWIAVRLAQGRARSGDFGLRRVPFGSSLRWAATFYGAFWLIALILLGVFGEPPKQDIVTELEHQDSFMILAGYAVLTCMFAPIAEEFFFRGFMFTVLARRMGPLWAAIAVGTVFGLVHAPGAPLLGVVVLGVFGVALCALYWRTGSIIPCMALHATHNSISFASTKSFSAWGFAGLMALSVGVVLAVAVTATRRPSPAVSA
jgi:membrane protease YdiL (CAAX protease family)